MAVTAFWYANAFERAFNKEIDFGTDDIGVILTTNSYTPNQDTHEDGGDVSNEVAESGGYLQGFDGTGELLASPTHTNTNNVRTFDSTDPSWTSTGAGITARRAVYADVEPAVAAYDPLLWWTDFGQDEVASGGGTFTIVHNASGIATITAADATGFP